MEGKSVVIWYHFRPTVSLLVYMESRWQHLFEVFHRACLSTELACTPRTTEESHSHGARARDMYSPDVAESGDLTLGTLLIRDISHPLATPLAI